MTLVLYHAILSISGMESQCVKFNTPSNFICFLQILNIAKILFQTYSHFSFSMFPQENESMTVLSFIVPV